MTPFSFQKYRVLREFNFNMGAIIHQFTDAGFGYGTLLL